MRGMIVIVAAVMLASVPADARFGGVLRGAGKAASSSAGKGAGKGAGKAAGRAAGGVSTPTAVPSVPAFTPRVPRGAPRAVATMNRDVQRSTALMIVMRSSDDGTTAAGARLFTPADEAASQSRVSKATEELVCQILESSPDAVEAVLDMNDAKTGGLDPITTPSLVDAEWARHAQRVKRIELLTVAATNTNDDELKQTTARLLDKERRRHQKMLALLYGKVHE